MLKGWLEYTKLFSTLDSFLPKMGNAVFEQLSDFESVQLLQIIRAYRQSIVAIYDQTGEHTVDFWPSNVPNCQKFSKQPLMLQYICHFV